MQLSVHSDCMSSLWAGNHACMAQGRVSARHQRDAAAAARPALHAISLAAPTTESPPAAPRRDAAAAVRSLPHTAISLVTQAVAAYLSGQLTALIKVCLVACSCHTPLHG